ncbi:hypothetical protein N7444_001478 [Penicillium canescens]|nr:hypothetical protein N7444_001478 [Penicillium canescens]
MEKDYRLRVFGKDLKQWFDQVDVLLDILRSSSAILSGAPVHKFLLPDVAEVVRNVEICVRNVDACRLLEYLRTQELYEFVLEPLMWDFHCCKVYRFSKSADIAKSRYVQVVVTYTGKVEQLYVHFIGASALMNFWRNDHIFCLCPEDLFGRDGASMHLVALDGRRLKVADLGFSGGTREMQKCAESVTLLVWFTVRILVQSTALGAWHLTHWTSPCGEDRVQEGMRGAMAEIT